MTKDDQTAILLIISGILDYPQENFPHEWAAMVKNIRKNIGAADIQRDMIKRLQPLYRMSIKDLQEHYVETFDYKEKTSLYLTAHELGDSRKRGEALIELQNLIQEAGYEHVGKELADYIPMLLEFLAVEPEAGGVERLKKRAAYAIHRIMNHLPSHSPYYQVMDLLVKYVFEKLDPEEIVQLETKREKADLDPLPYPMMYK